MRTLEVMAACRSPHSFLLLGLLGVVACSPDSPPEPAPRVQIVGGVGESLGRFRRPRAITVDRGTGRFYVVDRTGRVQLFDAQGAPILQWHMPAYDLGQPVGIVLEADGNVLINDSHYNRIVRYTPDGKKILASWGSAGKGPGQFTFGRDVTVDSEGYVYAGDYGDSNDRIQKFTPDGVFLLAWGNSGGEPGEFRRPQGMAIEPHGGKEFLLVADCANHRVQRFTLEGEFVSSFGEVGNAAGEMRYPTGVVAGDDGTLFVVEWGNNRVQRFDRDGRSLGFWGEPGRAPGQLATPWDIDRGPDGTFYVVDYDNHRVQIFRWPVEVTSAGSPSPAAGAREGRL